MSKYWMDAVFLLRKAADTIEIRSALRDSDDGADLIDAAAEICGLEADEVLYVLIALKQARFNRSRDEDSQVDLLAYTARLLAGQIEAEQVAAELPSIPASESPGPGGPKYGAPDLIVRPLMVPFDDDEPPLRAAHRLPDDSL